MKTNDTAFEFFLRDWVFLSFRNYTVLIDPSDNYISFTNDRLFTETSIVMNSIEDIKSVKLKAIVQLINDSKQQSNKKI